MNKLHRQRQAGFTLVELLVTVTVAIILLAVGIPAYNGMVANNRTVSQINFLATAFNLARSEAVSLNQSVTACANASATNTAAATLACGGAGNWANGWFVFEDNNANGVRDDATETVLKLWQALETGSNLAAGVGFVRYNSQGQYAAGAGTSFELTNTDSASTQERCVTINAMGQIRLERNACP